MNRPGTKNLSLACSDYFQVYPTPATARNDLLDTGPDADNNGPIARWPRALRVMGAIAEGSTGILCVERAADGAATPIPIPYTVVGQKLDLACRALVPTALTAVRLNGSAADNDDAVTLSGTPAANYELVIEIESTGGLNAGTFRWSDDDGATWEESGVTIPADGTHTLGASGLTATFADVEFTDDDIYRAESFLTDVTNVLVEW